MVRILYFCFILLLYKRTIIEKKIVIVYNSLIIHVCPFNMFDALFLVLFFSFSSTGDGIAEKLLLFKNKICCYFSSIDFLDMTNLSRYTVCRFISLHRCNKSRNIHLNLLHTVLSKIVFA